jgi:hypothetical protein
MKLQKNEFLDTGNEVKCSERLSFPVSTMEDTNATITYELLYTGNEIKCSGMVAISCLNNE